MMRYVVGVVAAADPGSQIGKNIGDMLQGLAGPVFLALLGLMAIAFLAGRKISQFAVYAVVAVGVGILIFDPTGVKNIITSIGDTITKGV
jgi:hypothetical protein